MHRTWAYNWYRKWKKRKKKISRVCILFRSCSSVSTSLSVNKKKKKEGAVPQQEANVDGFTVRVNVVVMWTKLAVFCQLNNPKLPSIHPQSPKYSIKNRSRRLGKSSSLRHLRQFAAMIASVSPPCFIILHGTYTIQKYTSSAHQTSFKKREICSLAQRPRPRRHMLRRVEKPAIMSIIKGKTRSSKVKYWNRLSSPP